MSSFTSEILVELKRAYPHLPKGRKRRDPFRTLVSCILSQRTRDANTAKASRTLFAVADTPEGVLSLPEETLRELIRGSGFYNQKAAYIRGACRVITEEHHGEVPSSRESLMRLPGVGEKTAAIVLSAGFGVPAIPVDVHVHRVAVRTGLAPPGSGPEKVKKTLEEAYPPEEYAFIDESFMRVGKEHCRRTNPRCSECVLGDKCRKVGVT